MKRKLLLVAMTTLVAFGLIAPAANADISGAGVIVSTGNAEVGQHFLTAAGDPIDCNKETAKDAHARGQGLYLPPPAPGAPTPKNGVWALHTTYSGIGIPNGTLDACGFLQHVGKVAKGTAQGPACGISKGHSGVGQVNFDTARGLNLFDLTWKTSAGGTLPVTGKYQVWNGTKTSGKQKKNKWGNILAQIQAQGGIPCTQSKNCPDQKTAPPGTAGCGAQSFTVAGTFELVQPGDTNLNGTPNEKKDVVRPKDKRDGDNDYNDGPLCKRTNGTSDQGTKCPYDDNKGNGKETPKPKPAG